MLVHQYLYPLEVIALLLALVALDLPVEVLLPTVILA
jgi:hypothetical protein